MTVCGTLPRHFLVGTEGNGGRIKHCLDNEAWVSSLQVIKPGKDFLVRTEGTTRLVTTGSFCNGCLPFVPVGSAFPRHLFVTAGDDGGGVEVGLFRNVRVRGL